MSPSARFVALCLAAGITVAACGSGDDKPGSTPNPPAPTTGAPTSSKAAAQSPAAWVDGYCGAIKGFLVKQNQMSEHSEGGSVEEYHRQTSAMLGEYVVALDEAIGALDALGPPPNPVADTAAQTARNNYAAARETAAKAKEKVDAAAPGDVDAQNAGVEGLVEAQGHAHKSLDPVGPLTGSPELLDATAEAPNCA